jgi:hypothetical protein
MASGWYAEVCVGVEEVIFDLATCCVWMGGVFRTAKTQNRFHVVQSGIYGHIANARAKT